MPDKNKIAIHFCTGTTAPLIAACLMFFFSGSIQSQDVIVHETVTTNVKDVGDVLRKVFHKKADTSTTKKLRSLAILPSLGYNPSFGFIIGGKASAIRQLGKDENTDLSAFGLEALYTSKGIITLQARHNVFSPENKWNFQGNWQLSKFLITDYSIGTGNKDYLTGGDSAFRLDFTYIRLTEKVYRNIGTHLYAGVGLSFNIRSNIEDEKLPILTSSPHYRYSQRNGFSATKYTANALVLAFEYNTREHPIRSYGGIYADFNLAFNQRWLGSTKNAIQLIYDIRKYLSLSSTTPEHVLAFWHVGSYKLNGDVPYLALPATGYDTYSRSGRGYTIGRFKGPSFAYFETEYRFPITRNKLLSGVAFMNFQTASDDLDKKVFQYWDFAGGGGLRILFQKHSRSTLCIDYAKGKYGSGGLFFGLNEAF
jgi:hypothetical protein